MAEPGICGHEGCERRIFVSGFRARCAQHTLTANGREPGPVGRVHFTNLDFSEQCLEDATIRDVTFDGETHFDRCRFVGEVRFESCAFTGYVSFVAATAGRLVFRDCSFTHIVDLTYAMPDVLSIRRSEFAAPVELALGAGDVDLHLTTFAGRSRLVGPPRNLELYRVVFRSGVQLRLDGTDVDLHDVEFGAPSSLRSYDGAFPSLLGVADTDMSRLDLIDTDLTRCTFIGAHNLDEVGIDSLAAFSLAPRGPLTRRYVLLDEACLRAHSGRFRHRWLPIAGSVKRDVGLHLNATQVASDYRALRKAREDAKDEPGAADFYYGEMEMRRMACREEMRDAAREGEWAQWLAAVPERVLLWLYWAVSGYGLRAWRAFIALVVVLLAASVIFRYAGFPGSTHTYAASLRFAVQSAMSLVRGSDEPLTATGEWVALALRLLGPLLFGLALLALRGRVRR